MEVSVVIPCLNEGDTIANCVGKALSTIANLGVAGEAHFADNASAFPLARVGGTA